jgi:hypothetical protein
MSRPVEIIQHGNDLLDEVVADLSQILGIEIVFIRAVDAE